MSEDTGEPPVCSSDTCSKKAKFSCEECALDFCQGCKKAHDIPAFNSGHTVSEIMENAASIKCSSCGKTAVFECDLCGEEFKYMCYTCKGSWHNVVLGSHVESVTRIQGKKPRGKQPLAPGQSVKYKSSSKSRRIATSLRHDADFRQYDVNTLRISIHRYKIGKRTIRNKWNCVVSGSKVAVDRFVKGKFAFGSQIRASHGDQTKWEVDQKHVFESPELQGDDDTNITMGQVGLVSPAKANVYGNATPGVQTRSMSRSASASAARYENQSPLKSPTPAQPRNLPRTARPLNFGVEEEELSDDENEIGNDKFKKLNDDPYEALSLNELSQKIWANYPNYEQEKVASAVKDLQSRYGIAKDCCSKCDKKKTTGFLREWVRCIGVMQGVQCLRRAHRVCCRRELYLCMEKGCSSETDKELSKELLYLFFNYKSRELKEREDIDVPTKEFQQGNLAKNTASLLRIVDMQ